jgi:hypothetical protein
MAIAGGGSGGVKAYEKAVRRATPSYNPPPRYKPSGGPQGGKGKTLSKRAIETISDATRYAEKIGSPMQFSDLANQYKQYNVKYDRPAVFRENYGDVVNTVGTPLASTYYKDPTTDAERFFTAAPPTLGQLFGDVGRGLFSGYNTYVPQSEATMGPYGLPVGPEGSIPISSGGYIQRQPGMLQNIAQAGMNYLGQGGLLGSILGMFKSTKEKQ